MNGTVLLTLVTAVRTCGGTTIVFAADGSETTITPEFESLEQEESEFESLEPPGPGELQFNVTSVDGTETFVTLPEAHTRSYLGTRMILSFWPSII